MSGMFCLFYDKQSKKGQLTPLGLLGLNTLIERFCLIWSPLISGA